MSSIHQARTQAPRRGLLAAALFLLIAVHSPISSQAKEGPEQANKALARRLYEEVLAPGKVERLKDFVAPDLVAGLEKRERFARTLFPDLSYTIEEILAEGDRVVVFYRATGHHTGDSLEAPASQGTLDAQEVDIFQIKGGMIREVRHRSDKLQVALATGYTLVPPE